MNKKNGLLFWPLQHLPQWLYFSVHARNLQKKVEHSLSASVSVGTRCLASQCDSLCLNDNLRYRLPQDTPTPDLYYIKHRFAHALEMYCRNHICLPCKSGHNHHPLQNKQEKMASSMDKTDTCIKLRNFKHCFIDIKMMKVLIKIPDFLAI